MKGRHDMADEARGDRDRILDFWFRELTPQDWFAAGTRLDPVVRDRFGALHAQALRGELDHWAEAPLGRLALIIVLDQFSRHIHRDTAQAFAADPRAQELAITGITAQMDENLSFAQRQFFYMPLMHAEDPAIQAMSVERFQSLRDFAEELLGYATGHAEEIERFGRFPGRNAALSRKSPPAEAEHIDKLRDSLRA